MDICLERCADLHMAQLMPLPLTVSCFSKIQIGFIFLVPAHPGSPGQRAIKRVCVCVTCRLTAKNRDQLRNPTLGKRVWATFSFFFIQVSRHQNGKTSLDLNEARDDGFCGWQWHQLDLVQTICTSLLTDNHTNTQCCSGPS